MNTINLTTNNHFEMTDTESKPNVLNLFKCKCPRCRKGDMFQGKNPWNLKQTMKMNKECPICHQPFDIEVGFYYGTSYVSYAFSIALSVATFVAWWLFIGFSLYGDEVVHWIIFNAIFLVCMQPYLMRIARTIWLAFFVRYDKNWKTNAPQPLERTNKDQENNW